MWRNEKVNVELIAFLETELRILRIAISLKQVLIMYTQWNSIDTDREMSFPLKLRDSNGLSLLNG